MADFDYSTVTRSGAGAKTFLEDEHRVIRSVHFGGAGGAEVVQRRTALIDRFLREIHGRLSPAGAMPILVAVGGYGRGELNPYSDIDILLLCRDEAERERSPEMLYALWDAGLDIGYSVRTVQECVELARDDNKIRTSLLESRLIAGDPSQYRVFLKTLRAEVFFRFPSRFITDKIAERAAVSQKFGGSLYLREPNLKESTGGLRDFHTALWIAFTRFRTSALPDLVGHGVVSEGQYAVALRSRNFLWRIRNQIHFIAGRRNDQLTFDMQEAAARDFRFRDSRHLLAVERMMKAYFIHARNIREFYHLVMHRVLPPRTSRSYTRAQSLGAFSLVGRTLVPSTGDLFQREPERIVEAFRIVQEKGVLLSDNLTALLKQQRVDDRLRSAPEVAAVFLAILDQPENLYATLTLMKDLRFLGRYLPEFRAIQSLARYDYYHKYTVDEHILMAVKNLEDLWSGRYPGLGSLNDALRGLNRRWMLFLAVLLHDLGKAFREQHDLRGVGIAEGILDRLSVAGAEREQILFLIKNHLVMANLSQRRELTDARVISDFAGLVKDRETLSQLYLLTYADISAVSPTAWTQWKATLLQDLYLRTLDHLTAGRAVQDADQTRLAAAVTRIREAAASRFSDAEINAFLEAMPEKYLLYTSSRRVLGHIDMMKRLPEERLIIRHRQHSDRGFTELTVCAYDAYGMFYRTAGIIAAQNLNILRAQAFTGRNGVMIDTFQITDAQGNICAYEDVWESVTEDLRSALAGSARIVVPDIPSGKSAAARIPPTVEFDNASSEEFTIVDIAARDRVGLLYRIAKTLYGLNLDIASAKITTEGIRAMDAFYVTDLVREKITDPARLARIKAELLTALE